eukprot:1161587-Pelagomonas_calceolata.AAC.21
MAAAGTSAHGVDMQSQAAELFILSFTFFLTRVLFPYITSSLYLPLKEMLQSKQVHDVARVLMKLGRQSQAAELSTCCEEHPPDARFRDSLCDGRAFGGVDA